MVNFFMQKTIGIPGPHALLSKDASDADKELATKIILSYTKADPQKKLT